MKQLVAILEEMGFTEKFTENTELQELGVNSLQLMEMVVRIEEKLDICIDDEDLMGDNFETIGSIMKMLEKYQK